MSVRVSKKVLSNGLTILALPRHFIPKVSTQLWYNVGSKDEKSGEKGIAHLIEHMIFKGTQKLSESDINLITHKLSGYCNAFTSYDYTGYLFDLPAQNWQKVLPIMADCMQNCTFKQEFLNSELQAVIQELKMYKDDYLSSVIEVLSSAIFSDHPYHHPIIGYKQDLWNLERGVLINFYRRHYVPNNATLVVVGDVQVEEVFELAEHAFGSIVPDRSYKKDHFYHGQDLRSITVNIYRDVQQPAIVIAWVVPGVGMQKDYLIELIAWLLGSGRGSRLHRKLVDELQLATEIEAFSYDLFEYALFFLYVQPKKLGDLDSILAIVQSEINDLAMQGPSEYELIRAIKKTEVDYLALLENNQKQAYTIGKYFLATGNEQILLSYLQYPKQNLAEEIKQLIATYLRSSVMHQGRVLPIASSEKVYWSLLQDLSDQEDSKILAGKTRHLPVEEGQQVFEIQASPPKQFEFPISHSFELANGLRVLHYHNPDIAKIDLVIDFDTKYFYDPEHLQGLSSFVADMLEEGTQKYPTSSFADILESFGMTFTSSAGYLSMSMLSADFARGLDLLLEVLTHASFDEVAIEKVRAQKIAEIKNYWDTPAQFASQLMRQAVYGKQHPFHKAKFGTEQSINYITKQDLVAFYKNYSNPRAARIALVGDMNSSDFDLLRTKLLVWQGAVPEEIIFPDLKQVVAHEINYPIARDQVVLCYAGLSVSRLHHDYDKLLLFDQIFTGGVLGSMSSRLFDLRESTGLFYTISGSLLNKSTKEPGMIVVKTIVSNDRLTEAENAIEKVIDTAIDMVTEEEFIEAKQAIINSLVDNFSSNHHIATALLYVDSYEFPDNYFYQRADQLAAITIKDMQKSVRCWLGTDKLAKIRIGRV